VFSIHFYRIYKAQVEIDLLSLEKKLSQEHLATRTRFSRVKTKSIRIDTSPILVSLGSISLKSDEEQVYTFQVQARIFDTGAISLALIYNDPTGTEGLEKIAFQFAGQEGMDEVFVQKLNAVVKMLYPVLDGIEVDLQFYEDYTVFRIKEESQVRDPVSLLMGEKYIFSEQIKDQVMSNRLSYSRDDFAIITWDTALICDPEDPGDLRDLIEFANVQLLELRYYDQLLNKQMDKMYDDIELAGSLSRHKRIKYYRHIMGSLMTFIADITGVTEKIDNLIKITEDIYYSRVYHNTLRVLRTDQWTQSVNRKLQAMQQNYVMLSNEVNIQHSNFLEWIIIILIALEFGFAILDALL